MDQNSTTIKSKELFDYETFIYCFETIFSHILGIYQS